MEKIVEYILENIFIIITVLGSLSSIVTLILYFKKKRKSKSKKFKRPKQSIKIKDFKFTDKKSTWWKYTTIGGCQSMVVCGVFRIESISDCLTDLTAIRMKKQKCFIMKKQKFYGTLKVEAAGADRGIFGNNYILKRGSDPKGETTMVFKFHITPAVIESENKFNPEKKLFTANLEIFDQFGNKHERKKVEFLFDDNQKFIDLDIVLPEEHEHYIFGSEIVKKMKSGAEKRYSHS